MSARNGPELRRNFSRSNLHGRVAHSLGEQIIRGEIAPGSLLPPEAELSRRLGVSRTALREAIKLMAAKGLVESRRKAGTRVRPRASWALLDPDVLAWQLDAAPGGAFAVNMFELRRIVEPAAAALAAERHTPAQAMLLQEASTGLASATDENAWIEALSSFYRVVLAASGNELIEALLFLPEASIVLAVQYEWFSANRPVTAAMRRAIIDAILARDPAAARSTMASLVDFVRNSMLEAIAAAEPGRPA